MNSVFYNELELSLLNSNSKDRKKWANTIINENISIQELAELLKLEKKIALRFQWLLTEIGLINPEKLLLELPFLLKLSNNISHFDFTIAFATYWQITSVPIQNESKAIELLFEWIKNPEINITIKTRALEVLHKLTDKYPELKNEFKNCLEILLEISEDKFKTKVNRIIKQLS